MLICAGGSVLHLLLSWWCWLVLEVLRYFVLLCWDLELMMLICAGGSALFCVAVLRPWVDDAYLCSRLLCCCVLLCEEDCCAVAGDGSLPPEGVPGAVCQASLLPLQSLPAQAEGGGCRQRPCQSTGDLSGDHHEEQRLHSTAWRLPAAAVLLTNNNGLRDLAPSLESSFIKVYVTDTKLPLGVCMKSVLVIYHRPCSNISHNFRSAFCPSSGTNFVVHHHHENFSSVQKPKALPTQDAGLQDLLSPPRLLARLPHFSKSGILC